MQNLPYNFLLYIYTPIHIIRMNAPVITNWTKTKSIQEGYNLINSEIRFSEGLCHPRGSIFLTDLGNSLTTLLAGTTDSDERANVLQDRIQCTKIRAAE